MVSKFKIGDKLKCVREFVWKDQNIDIELEYDSINTVKFIASNGNVSFNGVNYWDTDRFELYKEEPKVKQFDIKKDKWFVHVPDTEQAYAVVAHFKELGFEWPTDQEDSEIIGQMYCTYENDSCIGCTQEPFVLSYANKSFYTNVYNIPEIILTYKTVIDTITLPVLPVEPEETDAQKQLKVLKDQIAELSKQAELLEGSL